MPTVLITGCSSGFGLATARLFLDRGWSVLAAMRTPRGDVLPSSPRLRVLPLDVSDPHAIDHAIAEAGPLDALVNNAGIGVLNAVENTTDDTIREVFTTNTFGTMALSRAVLPQFRARRAGVIVNVSSTVTLVPLHLLAVYTASKAAVNAFTECLALELEPFGIRARLVLPGRAPDTSFAANARTRMAGGFPEPYAALAAEVVARLQQPGPITTAADVAEAAWRAVTDPDAPARLPAGADAIALAAMNGYRH